MVAGRHRGAAAVGGQVGRVIAGEWIGRCETHATSLHVAVHQELVFAHAMAEVAEGFAVVPAVFEVAAPARASARPSSVGTRSL